MSIPVPKTIQKPPKILTQNVKNWINGTVTAFDDGRTPLDGLRNSGNVYLDQDGTVTPRPSLSMYGPQPTGKVLGEIFEFKNVSGLTSTNWLICMQSFSVSVSPSASISPSSSLSPSTSLSPSSSVSLSVSPSSSRSPSASLSPSASQSLSPSSSRSPSSSVSSSVSASISPSSSRSPSSSASASISPSASVSPSASTSLSPSSSLSPSASLSPSSSVSASPSAPVTGYGQIFIARGEDTSWTPVTGKYFNPAAKAHFVQIAGKVLIMNGVDKLAYLDIPTSTVIPFTALSTPSAPSIANNGTTDITGTANFTIYYAISANSTVGETIASTAASQTVSTDRDSWDPTKNSLKITWSAVTNAKSYNVYMAQVATGSTPSLYLIASGLATGITSFIDDGSSPQDTTHPAPTANSTDGPVASRGANINGRVFLVGCKDNPYLVRYGGDFGFELDFSPANGGGFSPVGNGKDLPISVKSFRDARGSQQITVLCSGTNGKGKRFILTPDSLTVGNTVIEFFDVTEDSGQDGTDSPDAVILYSDSLWYPSRDGFKTTGTKPELQNVLSTDRVSNTIQRDISLLNSSAMSGAVGVGFEGRLYYALPVDASANNEIWVLDLQRGGAWMKPWNISADWLWLYNDNSGNSHLMALQNSQMFDLTYTNLTSDNGTAFSTSGTSGLIKFSPDGRQWGELIQVVFTILQLQGTINFQIAGRTEDSTDLVPLASKTVDNTPTFNPAGWGEASWGTYAWSDFRSVPTTFGNATLDVIVEVDAEVQYWQYSWNTTLTGVSYNLSNVVSEYVPLGLRDLS